MAKTLKYVSANGEEIDLRQFSCQVYKTNLHNYAWSPVGNERTYGINLTGWKKDALTLELQIAVRGVFGDRADILNRLTEVTERDVIELKAGRLYFGDWYLECFMSGSNTEPSDAFASTIRTWQVYAPYPFWIHEEAKGFYPSAPSEGDWLDYDIDYNYDYSFDENGVGNWDIQHYAPSDFIMTIYGYADEPRILINGHEYVVYTTLDNHDYLQINTRNKTVIKYLASGDAINIFDLRGKQSDIFRRIDPGQNIVTWNGTFGFDITALVERSEPRW